MDHFTIIQQFFTRLRCQACHEHFESTGIELIRQEEGLYLVHVKCTHCDHEAGIAMVGVEQNNPTQAAVPSHRFKDPELTDVERCRLSEFDPISENDVIEAHRFFQELGSDWAKHLPPIKKTQSQTLIRTQSPEAPI